VLGGEPAEKDLMDGVDTTWARFPGGDEIGRLAQKAILAFDTNAPGKRHEVERNLMFVQDEVEWTSLSLSHVPMFCEDTQCRLGVEQKLKPLDYRETQDMLRMYTYTGICVLPEHWYASAPSVLFRHQKYKVDVLDDVSPVGIFFVLVSALRLFIEYLNNDSKYRLT